MEYHDQPLQFISRFYFHGNTVGDSNHDKILEILRHLLGIKSTLVAVLFLSVTYIIPKLTTIIKRLTRFQLKKTKKLISELKTIKDKEIVMSELSAQEKEKYKFKKTNEAYFIQLPANNKYAKKLSKIKAPHMKKFSDKEKNLQKYLIDFPNQHWKIQIISLLMVSICITITLFVLSIISVIRIQQYSSEVIKENLQEDQTDHGGANIVVLVFSWVALIIFAVFKTLYDGFFGNGINVVSLAITSVVINLSHTLSYHMPYMVLAFIYNPLQTSITYFGLAFYILSGYFLFWSIESSLDSDNYNDVDDDYDYLSKVLKWNIYYKNSDEDDEEDDEENDEEEYENFLLLLFNFVRVVSTFGILAIVIYSSYVFIYILTLGSFDDFQGAQILIIPLVVGVFTYLIVRPTYKGLNDHAI